MNWGECYFDHFSKFFRSPVDRFTFAQGPESPVIQVLSYDGVFSGCRVFATLGLTHYQAALGRVAEVIVPMDDEWAVAPGLIANVLFHMIQNHQPLGRGVAISGLDKIDPAFVRRVDKSALYFTDIYGLPPNAEHIDCVGRRGTLYLGMFISMMEYNHFRQVGAESLESEFERQQVDPYSVRRPSLLLSSN